MISNEEERRNTLWRFQSLGGKASFWVALVLASVPPGLVVADRWFNKPLISLTLSHLWCRIDFLCALRLPPYFLLALMTVPMVLLLVWCDRKRPVLPLTLPIAGDSPAITPLLFAKQRRAASLLVSASSLALLILAVKTLLARRLPGWDLVCALLVHVIGCLALELSPQLLRWLRSNAALLASATLSHASLVLYLLAISARAVPVYIPGYILLLVFALLVSRYRARIHPLFWIVSAAILLQSLYLDAWWFAIVGDEYAFYDYARQIAEHHGWTEIGSRLFYGTQVYGSHPYLSSLIQASFIKLLGTGNFGWRFHGVYLSAISLPFFFVFFRAFVSRRVALWACVLLACSQYLMGFARIGYNNLQALLGMSMVLAASVWNMSDRRRLSSVCLALAVSFCLYVYPAALYALPLAILMLVMFRPKRLRQVVAHYGSAGLVLVALVAPLLVQPDYWRAMTAGTLLHAGPNLNTLTEVLKHLATNLVYAGASFLYAVEESHFVAVSYLDPLSATFLVLGLAIVLVQKASRPKAYLLISYVWLLVSVGASHESPWPHTTRMFLLLPFFALFAALGIQWLESRVHDRVFGAGQKLAFSAALVCGIVVLNLYQAYPLGRWRMERYQNLETLFLRVLVKAQQAAGEWQNSYTFITDAGWGIEGMRHNLQRVYELPTSPLQLIELRLSEPVLSESDKSRLADSKTLVVIKPWLDADWKRQLEEALHEIGKVPCDVRTTKGTVRFQLWHSGSLDYLCGQ